MKQLAGAVADGCATVMAGCGSDGVDDGDRKAAGW